MTILVTGGSGFIGSALVLHLLATGEERVVNLDRLTYAAVPGSLPASLADDPRYVHERADIADSEALARIFATHRPRAVLHLAAESHVDRSIDGPTAFVETNVVGTQRLLDAALAHWRGLPPDGQAAFRFVHVSTDEVFGSLEPDDPRFTAASPYRPRSPYAASKAAADHLARAWHHTYGLPVIVTNCTNNYGPRQHPEKLIPLMIIKASAGLPLPVYGRGDNVRDWLHVEDHARGLALAARRGVAGETYCFGGDAERSNLALVERLCDLLDDRLQRLPDGARRGLIRFVADRPGHDRRYAMDVSETTRSLGWRPARELETGLAATVDWYLRHEDWWRPVVESGATDRLGLPAGTRLAG